MLDPPPLSWFTLEFPGTPPATHPGERVGRLPRGYGQVMIRGWVRSLVAGVYLLVGVVVASDHHYLHHLHGVRPIVSAALAVVLWPLVIAGADLHLH